MAYANLSPTFGDGYSTTTTSPSPNEFYTMGMSPALGRQMQSLDNAQQLNQRQQEDMYRVYQGLDLNPVTPNKKQPKAKNFKGKWNLSMNF